MGKWGGGGGESRERERGRTEVERGRMGKESSREEGWEEQREQIIL